MLGGSVAPLRAVSVIAAALLFAALLLAALLVPAGRLIREGRLLTRVIAARLIALKVGLLLCVEVLLVATVLQLLRVYAKLIEHTRMLLRVNLTKALQLLGGLLMISAKLAYQIHDLVRIKRHRHLSSWLVLLDYEASPFRSKTNIPTGIPFKSDNRGHVGVQPSTTTAASSR